MYYTTLVEIADGINDGTDDIPGFFLSIDLFFEYFLIEFPACEVFEDKVDIFFIWVEVVELDDVGVADIFHDVDLSFEEDLLLFVHFLSE